VIAHLRQLALDAGDDVHRGVGAGSWLVRRQLDAAVCKQAAELLTAGQPHSSFVTHSLSAAVSTLNTCLDLNVRCRVTSKVDLDDPFYDGFGWLIEVFPEPSST
jgi:hypothetical protein